VARGDSAALRFAVPAGRSVTFRDIVRGELTFATEVIGDPVTLRSNGRPAYNFAVVVDDARMKISHVVRGEDHISNTPRQILLYEALDLTTPVFAHLSLVLGPDHAPLSKRHGATSVAEFRERGYLPEALVNYLALLGWSPGESEELLDVREMARRFDLERVTHSAAVFDVGKLAWINRHYMKASAPDRTARLALPYFVRAGWLADTDAAARVVQALLPIVVGAVDRLEDTTERLNGVFGWTPELATEAIGGDPDAAQAARVIEAFARETAEAGPLDREAFRAAADRVKQQTGLKGRTLFHPIRDALTGASSGPELDLIVPAIDNAAQLPREVCLVAVPSCRERAAAVAERLRSGGAV
jgi:glutamyl-tRNA synthetase/nondiscriminating glutamyl-tRNA synthetase